MNEIQKPFACTIEGCQMTFTNEDHLNWHHKKHDMVLNLGLANKDVEVADQTPTPTRFIRNCEEVGLFQDLQNVNPFDETFKKAIESAKSGTLHVPEVASNDDTLHTPHIFPHVEENVDKYIDTRNDNQSTPSSDFCINNVPSIQESNESNENYDLTIVTEDDKDNNVKNKNRIDLKSKLKETIKNKAKTSVITPVPLEKLKINNGNEAQKRPQSRENDVNTKKQRVIDDNIDDDKAKVREMNRAAQLRCRKRKKMQWKRMEEDLKALTNENMKLLQENQNFKHKFYALKELLVKQKRDNATQNNGLLSKLEEILNSTPKKGTTPENKLSANHQRSIKSKISPKLHLPAQAAQKPVLIQVMGSVAQLAVSVLPQK